MLRRLCVFFQLDICDRFVFGIAAFVLRGSVEKKLRWVFFVSQYFIAWTVSLSLFVVFNSHHKKHLNNI